MMRTLRAAVTGALLMFGAVASGGAASGAGVAATAARLDALYISIHGHADELRAAERLNYERVEGGTAACMHAHGRTAYRPVPYDGWYRDFTDADLGYGNGYGSVLDSLGGPGRRHLRNEAAQARLLPDQRDLAPQDVDVYNACTAPYGHSPYWDFIGPTMSLDDLLAPVEADPVVQQAAAPYSACMHDRFGYTIGERPDDLLYPKSSMDAKFAADAECRRPAYTAAMLALAPRITPWEQRHRAELTAVRQQWRQLVADAARLPR
ncbi:hypothetical protein Dvina_30010 [Dactylosporangium vinaceum]|uniref:Secreted protein n=1 Tax=Dactylosporangium vinaceum TaxID=53362 RepID=A0ABV5LZA7_9ACTN|nr:hypothetical protein [Dactylosporangium vinaceum]UAB92574.1 hypothetical protein Dvina_30010 [Dactylosporangium vinaceum]